MLKKKDERVYTAGKLQMTNQSPRFFKNETLKAMYKEIGNGKLEKFFVRILIKQVDYSLSISTRHSTLSTFTIGINLPAFYHERGVAVGPC